MYLNNIIWHLTQSNAKTEFGKLNAKDYIYISVSLLHNKHTSTSWHTHKQKTAYIIQNPIYVIKQKWVWR